jgi:uncharacterized membrane protein
MPFYERLFLAGRWILLGVLALGAVFSAINNARAAVTPIVTYFGSVALLLFWGIVAGLAYVSGIAWTEANGHRVRLRRLSAKTHFFFLGCFLLLWVPRGADRLRVWLEPAQAPVARQAATPESPPKRPQQAPPQSPQERPPTPQPPWREAAPKNVFTFKLIDVVPVAKETHLAAINDAGDIIGTYRITDRLQNFLYFANGRLMNIEPPQPNTDITMTGLNNKGEIVGALGLSQAGRHGGFFRGFVRRANETFEFFDCFGSSYTRASAINDRGQIVGNALDPTGVPKAFIREPNGECLSLEYPGGFTALPAGITNEGEIIGIWTDPKFGERGFLRRKDKTFVSIQPDPNTYAHLKGINAHGTIVGYTSIGGFLRKSDGTLLPLDHPQCAGSNCTFPMGVNKGGDIVGRFQVGSNVYGFRATEAKRQKPALE